MKSDPKRNPPYVNFALDLSASQLTRMHRRMARSPHKFKFTLTKEQQRRKLFAPERRKKGKIRARAR